MKSPDATAEFVLVLSETQHQDLLFNVYPTTQDWDRIFGHTAQSVPMSTLYKCTGLKRKRVGLGC